ncbi:hypothetical protein AAFC00_000053 [Neodothiora populina]|uniref:BAR domain-containing protein n=1 Tax=Neodothiora populina TaxID=2781224 RepID=A0ABR3P186_9PEZI
MNINKRLDRMKQWAGERMGGEVKTGQTDEFKALEMEMQLRHEGMDRMQKSTTTYIKSLSKVKEAEDKEKALPIGLMGATMVHHADDFEPDSEFGQCLTGFGRANERIARMQENYVANATTSWLESVERSLAQMKEYQTARKKLDQRRLAFDTSQAKMNKSKKEDFRMEEELRAQRAKYEESQDDVHRRMLDIKEAEVDSIADLTAFLEAEFAYYDRAREVLMQLKRDWPANPNNQTGHSFGNRRTPRSRSNTNNSFRGGSSNGGISEDPEEHVYSQSPSTMVSSSFNDSALRPPPTFASRSRTNSTQNSPRRELPGFDLPVQTTTTRPQITSRSATTGTFEGPASSSYQNSRDVSPAPMHRIARVATDGSSNGGIALGRSQLKPVNSRSGTDSDVFGDPEMDDYRDNRSISPSGSYNNYNNNGGGNSYNESRSASWSVQGGQQSQQYSNGGGYGDDGGMGRKKGPPPPPPSRAKKPPPPPPMKRSALSSNEVPRY